MKLQNMLPSHLRQALEEKWPLFLPSGTIEYHGEHLPLGVDTFAVIKALDEVEKRINCVIAPPIWYGPASFAVAGPEKGTIQVDDDRFGKHVSDVMRGLLDTGFRNIIVVIHHQFEMGQLMPEALAFKKAGVSLIFELLEKERGRGWWGSEKMASYYAHLTTPDNPFRWIQVVPLMSSEIQEKMGYDHAGKLETSLMMAAVPETVNLAFLEGNIPWFTREARQASQVHGERTFQMIVDYLIELAR
ncbi:MAG: creatininase family protein [Candidatus Atribacteria bacterium]|nr:creatininase family protein [Candidatus Atribacteria bacterium]